ncbi:MAG TPA: hypothetical protein VIS74_06225 [Chthoniobacterales bacterium]
MKPRSIYPVLLALFLGAVITRECVSGMLQPAERAYRAWLQEAIIPNPQPRVTVITSDDASRLLNPLDVALFLRAAMQFGADVAALSVYELDSGDGELLKSVLSRESPTGFVAGALLSKRDQQADPVNFQQADWPAADALPAYSGVWNSLPVVPSITYGFLNLSEHGAAETVPLFAKWQEQTVASFSLVCLTRYLSANGVELLPTSGPSALRFSNQCRIPVSRNATVPLSLEVYAQIPHYRLGDLLLAAEKSEQELSMADPALPAAIKDRIVVLIPAPTEQEAAAETLTLGQFQALGIASLADQLRLPAYGLWVWAVPFLWFFPWLKITEKWRNNGLPLALLLLSLYGLAATSLASAAGLLLPGIPALAWAAALLLIFWIRQKWERA